MKCRILLKLIVAINLILGISGCIIPEEDDDSNKSVIFTGDFQYDVYSPANDYKLPGELVEISGLAYWKEDILLCVEDEKGYLYLYDHGKEEIIQVIKFGKKGDYEGVTQSEDIAYVVKSTGKLYYFNIEDEPEVSKVDLPFTSRNELEGITKGHKKDEFYIACKQNSEILENGLKGRAVYSYNVTKDKVKTKPYIHLTTESFKEEIINAGLYPSNHMPFMPSGIAVHPHTEDVFLISSVGKLLVVLDKTGSIVSMAPLKRSLFRQPEGICFDHDGNMFISSEGRGKKGYILKFIPAQIDQTE
jgi:uncharacterized protein YjiK